MTRIFYRLNIYTFFVAMLPATLHAQQDTTRQVNLQEVTVTSAQQGMLQNRSSLGQLETINRSGLTKMACCTLSSSFENTATTQTSYSDAVTGTRQIQMLGLSGIYTQTMAENVPALRGLAYMFGWDYTPASWLEGISISKGAGTVVNGFEGITGQINLDYRKPNTGQPIYIDLYTDTELHNEVNAVAKHQFSAKLFGALFLHTTQTTMPERWHSRMDANDDGFMDMPKVHNYNIYNRWLFADEDHGVQSRMDVHFTFDQREAGQTMKEHRAHAYGVGTRNLNFQASNKTGISIGHREGQSLGIINSITLHGLRTHYGPKGLHSDQKSYFGNVIFNSDLGPGHTYQVGASYLFDLFETSYTHRQHTPDIGTETQGAWPDPGNSYEERLKVSDYGLFAEYTNTQLKDVTVQMGLRADYMLHHGWLLTPRLNIKYAPRRWVVARLSAGRGYRMAHPLTEQMGLMASGRLLLLGHADDRLEHAWNIGGNVIFTIPIWNQQEATLSADFYHVQFGRRLVTDLDASPLAAYIYESPGKSYSDTWQTDLSMPLAKGLTMYAAWRYTLQRITQMQLLGNGCYTASVPLVPSYKALLNLQYATAMRRWVFDTTIQLNGRTRLPGSYDATTGTLDARHSPAYVLLFAQVTKRFRLFDVYIGSENLLSYRQENPIIGWEDPYATGFDASQVWAPITGRKVYAGIRFNIGKYF